MALWGGGGKEPCTGWAEKAQSQHQSLNRVSTHNTRRKHLSFLVKVNELGMNIPEHSAGGATRGWGGGEQDPLGGQPRGGGAWGLGTSGAQVRIGLRRGTSNDREGLAELGQYLIFNFNVQINRKGKLHSKQLQRKYKPQNRNSSKTEETLPRSMQGGARRGVARTPGPHGGTEGATGSRGGRREGLVQEFR